MEWLIAVLIVFAIIIILLLIRIGQLENRPKRITLQLVANSSFQVDYKPGGQNDQSVQKDKVQETRG